MNGEKGFKPQQNNGMLDRRSSKVSPGSFEVRRDTVATTIARKIFGNHDDEPIFSDRSGKVSEQQREKFETIQKVVEKEWLPEFKIEFLEKMDILRQNGDLNLSSEEIKKRLAAVQIFFYDKASIDGANIEAKGTTSRYSTVHLEIDSFFPGDEQGLRADLQHTFNHEMLHAVSGSLFLTTPRHLGFFNAEKYRRGLVFGPRAKGDDTERFLWLNEALTETLALDMDKDGYNGEAVYPDERLLLKLLIDNSVMNGGEKKLNKKKFSNAYFENYESKDSDENRLQHWKELMRSINNSYYPGFLVKIDKLIKEKGIGYVVRNFHILCEDRAVRLEINFLDI